MSHTLGKIFLAGLLLGWIGGGASGQEGSPGPPDTEAFRVVQMVPGEPERRYHADGLPTLLRQAAEATTLRVDPEPLFISSFEDGALLRHPMAYANYADREDWTLTEGEKRNLKAFLDRGGFLFIDAGINSDFLGKQGRFGQFHSFADYQVTPALAALFKELYPEKSFQPLPRSHPVFHCFYSGLPDPSALPDTVKDYTVNEKWPQGTYSMLGLEVGGRLAVLTCPVISMGWGRNRLGQWSSPIGFRVRESGAGLSNSLAQAAAPGTSFSALREDGQQEKIYCEREALPAWVNEPGGQWRVFRYYNSREISDYAHVFFTRLGVNVLVYGMTE